MVASEPVSVAVPDEVEGVEGAEAVEEEEGEVEEEEDEDEEVEPRARAAVLNALHDVVEPSSELTQLLQEAT